jgi:signal-transduction protein with cAMP-binding, CBS, and nucleotidyltransferase domain
VKDFLKNQQMFKHLGDEELFELTKNGKLVKFADGDKMITKGDFGKYFFLIYEGKKLSFIPHNIQIFYKSRFRGF